MLSGTAKLLCLSVSGGSGGRGVRVKNLGYFDTSKPATFAV